MPKTITYTWEDGKFLTLTLDQFELVQAFVKDTEHFWKCLRFLAELPGHGGFDKGAL